jgi:hypothetical protein
MIARDSVKSRLNTENGISFTEFSYQLLQAYDFVPFSVFNRDFTLSLAIIVLTLASLPTSRRKSRNVTSLCQSWLLTTVTLPAEASKSDWRLTSGRSTERTALEPEVLQRNIQGITNQVHRFFERGDAYVKRQSDLDASAGSVTWTDRKGRLWTP